MVKVPNNFQFLLSDVVSVIKPLEDSLSECFNSSVDEFFDPLYKGDKNSLRNFRNYGAPFIKYGYLYNWYAINENQKHFVYGQLYNWYAINKHIDENDSGYSLAPEGWRIPSNDDWWALKDYLVEEHEINEEEVAGTLKSCRQVNSPEGGYCDTNEHPRWNEHQTYYGTDDWNFSALPGGSRSSSGTFQELGTHGHWWSTGLSPGDSPIGFSMIYNDNFLYGSPTSKSMGLSVKCVRDATTEEQELDDGDYVEAVFYYNVVYLCYKIGEQVWMKQNLVTTKYRNGEDIPYIEDNLDWENDTSGACCAYGLNDDYVGDSEDYALAPDGWRVATAQDWDDLIERLIEEHNYTLINVGNALKSCRQINSPEGGYCDTNEHPRWEEYSTHEGTDNFHFSAIPGGYRTALFFSLGYAGYWWTSTQSPTYNHAGVARYMFYDDGGVWMSSVLNKHFGMSVKCVRDATETEKLWDDGVNAGNLVYQGRTYYTTKIGKLVWMIQNLATTKYRGGEDIPYIEDNLDWENTEEGAYCAYNNDEANALSRNQWAQPAPLPQADLILLLNPSVGVLNVSGAGTHDIDANVNINTWENVEVGQEPQYEFVNWTVTSGETPDNFNPNLQQQTIKFKGACTLTANWSEI